ncbi:uncharacterized protein LOC131164145 isoform X1 [Malania oleifera]|uniref:uncharacterized protein LOC131164145 isoform X1 n=1 Tax=Malania oleifera TaxID=397392 RepID=UPI0025ADD64B|nr:uncharacterized protein LOC131164145 isoform X1 [Malania oleifera]
MIHCGIEEQVLCPGRCTPALVLAATNTTRGRLKAEDAKMKKKKKRGGRKRKMTAEQIVAHNFVNEWVFLESSSVSLDVADEFGVQKVRARVAEKVVFELHSHSTCSDGFLPPSKLVERAHANGVKVLALTDHDTMAGIPEAMEAACRFGIKIIPGVEISTVFSPREGSESEEPVHILAYYSGCGPRRFDEVEKFLANIRDGRFLRAKKIISKLNDLKLPIRWESVARIAGKGVAPGRLHVARAMVEAGHVENLKQAFSRYLYDGGPAYSTGSEPLAEEAVAFIRDTGGVSVLAHPWALKNPIAIIRRLTDAGLHGLEVYRSDGKLAALSDLADAHALIKLGGSDYHGKGGHDESSLGSVNLPVLAVQDFLKIARPIWCSAIQDILNSFAEEPSNTKLQQITKFGNTRPHKGVSSCGKDLIELCVSSWLTDEERQNDEFEAIRLKLSNISICQGRGLVL